MKPVTEQSRDNGDHGDLDDRGDDGAKVAQKPDNRRNLLRGGGPGRGRGPIQRGVWQALVFAGGEASTTDVLDHVYCRRRLKRRWFPNGGHYKHVRRRLDEIADRVGRSTGNGQPWIWRLKDGL